MMTIKRLAAPLLTVAALAGMTACIKNDIPFPRIPQLILTLAADGEAAPADIDAENYAVSLVLDETADIRHVRFSEYTFTEGAVSDPDLLDGNYDLSSPLVVTLSRYQDYQWVITASQTIERYLTVEGQIGATVIDAVGHRIIVRVPETADLANLKITSLKLGPEGITSLSPHVEPGIINLSRPFQIDVTVHGVTEVWTIYAEKEALLVSTSAADAWSEVIWVYGEAPADETCGFQYKKASDTEWTDAPAEWIQRSGGSFSAALRHLLPETEYVVRAVSGGNIGNEMTVTTQPTEDIPDGSFDQWWLNGKVWCPWSENGPRYWDTGNTGAATMGQSNVQPSDFTPDGTGQSAKLETRFVGIGAIGKLAAGSIFTGQFARVDGTNGILDFGRPWNLRPTKLKGYFQYTTAPVNYTSAEYKYLEGRPDSCHIYVALADWTAPFEIRTNPKNRQLFNPSMQSVIAYGELVCGESFSGYREFEIPLVYRSTSRVPTYLQITAAASKYGDYFTGGAGATLFIDQLSFDYDY